MTKSLATSSAPLDLALVEASADSALLAINQAATHAGQLIDEWVRRANAAAISEVAAHGTGSARKAARHALNVLKARGVKVPERKRVVSLVSSKADEIQEAWLLAPDAAGNVLFVFTSHTPASRYKAAFVVMHEAFGIHRVEVGELSQSQLKDAIARAMPGAEYKPVRAPLPWARARVAAARKCHAERGIPEPLGITSAAPLITPVPEVAPPHPLDEEGLELSEDDAREMAKHSARLHALPEFRTWFPSRAAVDEMLGHVGEALKPGEEPDPDVLRGCIEQEIAAATDRYFSPQRRLQLVSALKDSALSVLQREGEVPALEVVSAIKLIERAGLITDPPHEIGFLRAFFEKAVSVLLQQGQGRLRIPVRGVPGAAEPGSAAGDPDEAPSVQAHEAPADLVDASDRSGEPLDPVSDK